jgi:uncharacterized repeat protein (TIGR01451 family)
VAIAALAVVSATAASVDVGDGGSAGVFRVNGAAKGKVFVCKYVGTPGVDERLQTGDNPIDVSVNAIPDYQGVGSWFADAQGRSYVLGPEHEANEHVDEPSVSSCPQPEVPPTDVCPNIEGNQAEIPNGMVEDEKGNCVTPPPPPTDVCPNIEGDQGTVPDGYQLVDGQCVLIPPPPSDVCPNLDGVQETVPYGYKLVDGTCVKKHHKKDVCPNLEGKQTEVPDGYEIVDGQCVPIPPPPTDVCPNIEGDQAEIPAGMVKDEQGKCVPIAPPPTDVCPNIEGNQAEIPAGMVKDEGGNCVKPTTPPPPPPPSVTSDEFMDVQVVKDATAQVQLVEGQAQIAYTIRVRNEGPNGAHEVELVDAAPSGVTFVAVTLPLSAGSCTVTPALLHCSLGSLGPGVERTIQLSARVAQTGTYVNWATATGNGKDTNGANNTDDASTLVTAPATPPAAPAPTPKPAAKPKPKPHVNICRVLKVTPGMVKANGNRQLVVAKVTQSRNPVRGVAVRFSGKGLRTVVRTNAQGVARVSIAPRKAGIMLVKITSAKACNTARIGVIGAFEPPVTG